MSTHEDQLDLISHEIENLNDELAQEAHKQKRLEKLTAERVEELNRLHAQINKAKRIRDLLKQEKDAEAENAKLAEKVTEAQDWLEQCEANDTKLEQLRAELAQVTAQAEELERQIQAKNKAT